MLNNVARARFLYPVYSRLGVLMSAPSRRCALRGYVCLLVAIISIIYLCAFHIQDKEILYIAYSIVVVVFFVTYSVKNSPEATRLYGEGGGGTATVKN